MNRLVVAVVAVNGSIALGGLYLSLRLWRWRQSWATLADALALWEQELSQTLSKMTATDLDLPRQKLQHLRHQYTTFQRWIGYLPYLRRGLNLVVNLSFKRHRGTRTKRG